ncbi:DegT/DnrJ/EryC1/StrS family aminotransferase [Streptomyces sp. NPDC003023]|uniref:DegT/DnrJ/EryC1/StrS family aminotransferase n=1 Tax=Streptomyces sp. NPDC003023 TaxID=3364675 RepID=UPI0036BB3BDF
MTTAMVAGTANNARPFLYGPEEAALAEALRSGHYGHTDVTDQFEADVAAFLGVPETVAVASGTSALHVALLAAGVGPGHEVIVPSLTFCATIQAILAVGARPRFVEVNPRTVCVGSAEVLDAVTADTRAVMPVLYGGRAVDLSEAQPVFAEQGITVIEDAAHAFGSYVGERRVGATGALTCFSFGPIKNLTCGQGGMIVPRNALEAAACRKLRGLGIVESAARRAEATGYTVEGFGLRVQLSALNAAIGAAQLGRFPEAEAKRKALWRVYATALQGAEGVTMVDVDVERSVPHLCAVLVHAHRDQVFRMLRDQGVGVGTHYPPNHQQPAFAPWHRSLPVTERVGRQIMTLPFHQHLTETDGEHVAAEVLKAVTETAAVG